jgi:hypothetical protein
MGVPVREHLQAHERKKRGTILLASRPSGMRLKRAASGRCDLPSTIRPSRQNWRRGCWCKCQMLRRYPAFLVPMPELRTHSDLMRARSCAPRLSGHRHSFSLSAQVTRLPFAGSCGCCVAIVFVARFGIASTTNHRASDPAIGTISPAVSCLQEAGAHVVLVAIAHEIDADRVRNILES